MKDNVNMFLVYIIICTLFCQITITNSRTSTFWKLNPNDGKITGYNEQVKDFFIIPSTTTNDNIKFKSDTNDVFTIITSTVISYGSGWSKQSIERTCDSVEDEETKKLDITPQQQIVNYDNNNSNINNNDNSNNNNVNNGIDINSNQKQIRKMNHDILDCGKPVNFTYYDYLIGVAQRFNHPSVPEPEVAYLFLKNKDEKSLKNFDINALEKRLKRAKRDKPKSVNLYNQIGNYWRIKGDTRQSIECFRKALAISPTNAEVLLNLARVLFNLQYLDDAIHLTRRSLEVQPPDRSAWRQYFTLGEIFKAYGHFQESLLHLRHALELYPQHEPILKMLRDVENSPASPLHVYTLLIIFALVIAVFIVIVTSSDNSDKSNTQSEFEPKMQRHFNRAMAMRSLKGLSSRTFKHRKY